jgi:hypothetical protein
MRAELWGDIGLGVRQRVRVGVRRVVTGHLAYRSWAIVEFPRIIHLAWLRPLTSESLLCNIAVHVRVRRPGPTRRSLQRRVRQWRGVDSDDDYALAVADAKRIIGELRRNRDTEASVGVYVTAQEAQADQVAEALETAQCEFRPANGMQHRALHATRPLGGDPFGRTLRADLRSVATTDLLATAGYWPVGATLLGEALSAPEPIGINLFDDATNINWSLFVAIMMGGGKTTLAHTLAWRMANPHPKHPLAQTGVQVVSVDFKSSGDYAQLYRHLEARGHRARYNAWASGPLPPIAAPRSCASTAPRDGRSTSCRCSAPRTSKRSCSTLWRRWPSRTAATCCSGARTRRASMPWCRCSAWIRTPRSCWPARPRAAGCCASNGRTGPSSWGCRCGRRTGSCASSARTPPSGSRAGGSSGPTRRMACT